MTIDYWQKNKDVKFIESESGDIETINLLYNYRGVNITEVVISPRHWGKQTWSYAVVALDLEKTKSKALCEKYPMRLETYYSEKTHGYPTFRQYDDEEYCYEEDVIKLIDECLANNLN